MAGVIAAGLVSADVIVMGTDEMPYDMNNVNTEFSLGNFIAVSGAIGGVAGLIALITRSGTYANYATLIWLVGVFGGVATWVLTGFTNMFEVLLPAEINPGGLFSSVIYGGVLIGFFFFLAGTISQRPDL
jgi:hypothetical protein